MLNITIDPYKDLYVALEENLRVVPEVISLHARIRLE
jgi:hypothetical protein